MRRARPARGRARSSPQRRQPMRSRAGACGSSAGSVQMGSASAGGQGWRESVPCMRQRSEEHTSELQSPCNLVCRLLLEKKKKNKQISGYKETNIDNQSQPNTVIVATN